MTNHMPTFNQEWAIFSNKLEKVNFKPKVNQRWADICNSSNNGKEKARVGDHIIKNDR